MRRLINYIFWWCGLLYLALEISFWWLLSLPFVIMFYVMCEFYLLDKEENK